MDEFETSGSLPLPCSSGWWKLIGFGITWASEFSLSVRYTSSSDEVVEDASFSLWVLSWCSVASSAFPDTTSTQDSSDSWPSHHKIPFFPWIGTRPEYFCFSSWVSMIFFKTEISVTHSRPLLPSSSSEESLWNGLFEINSNNDSLISSNSSGSTFCIISFENSWPLTPWAVESQWEGGRVILKSSNDAARTVKALSPLIWTIPEIMSGSKLLTIGAGFLKTIGYVLSDSWTRGTPRSSSIK